MTAAVSKSAAVGNLTRAAALLILMPVAANAQGFGVRTGASINPDQLTVGGQYELGPISDRIWVQPSVDVGFGDGATLVTANLDLVYRRALTRQNPWTLYAGGGPAVNFYKLNGYNRTLAGANVIAGLAHRSGLFTQAAVGLFDSPRYQFGVGYRFQPHKSSGRGPRR